MTRSLDGQTDGKKQSKFGTAVVVLTNSAFLSLSCSTTVQNKPLICSVCIQPKYGVSMYIALDPPLIEYALRTVVSMYTVLICTYF